MSQSKGNKYIENNTYYTSQKIKLLDDMDKFTKPLRREMVARYGEQDAIKFIQETMIEYEKLIPQFPYIGGKHNPLTSNLVQAGYGLALYRALLQHGGTLEEAGELCHLGVELRLRQIPAFLRRWIGNAKYSRRHVRDIKQLALLSQQRRYPGDWVWDIFEGDGQTFDVGIDYTECGIDKFMRSQGAEELTPYLCNTDYVSFASIGIELKRTKTLAWGCDCCDFRIKRRGTPPPAWPPRFIEQSCGKEET